MWRTINNTRVAKVALHKFLYVVLMCAVRSNFMRNCRRENRSTTEGMSGIIGRGEAPFKPVSPGLQTILGIFIMRIGLMLHIPFVQRSHSQFRRSRPCPRMAMERQRATYAFSSSLILLLLYEQQSMSFPTQLPCQLCCKERP